MSKTAKKLLSVFLAVLVLAAGFSTTLGAFRPVSANSVTVYDYTTIVPEFNAKEVFLANKGSGWNANHAIPTDALGLFDYNGISTNLDANHTGLRVYDDFFTVRNGKVVGTDDASKVYPYVTYEVEPGTSFSAVYNTYNINCWNGFNLAEKAEEYHLAEILVSSDGVNFIPAKVENNIVYDTFDNYDTVTATVANVGANTRYVKFQFACDADAQTYRFDEEKKEWVYNYVPQDALMLQRVTLTAPTAASTESVVDFTNTRYANTNAAGTTDNYTGYATVNGVETALNSIFIAQPVQSGYEGLSVAAGSAAPVGFGLRAKDYSSLAGTSSFNAWPTTDIDWFMRVQPGTRFFMSYNGHANTMRFAQSAVDLGLIEDVEDLGFKVYTAANLKDFENGTATEHRLAASSIAGARVSNFKYNFIIPENHTYVRIVHPLTGGLQYVPIYTAGGTREDNVVGNDRFCFDHITYTPFSATYNTTSEYISAWGKNATDALENTFSGSASTNTAGLGGGYVDAAAINSASHFVVGVNERTDDQLMYATWCVVPDSYFTATLRLRYSGAKDQHDAATSKEDMHYSILTSPDNYTWTEQATLGLSGDIYDTNTPNYDVTVYVPEDARYVKILSYCRGYLPKYSCNDAFGVNGVSYDAPKNTDASEEVFYDYKNLTQYSSSNNGQSKDTALTSTDAAFAEATGSVDSSLLWLDTWASGTGKLGVWVNPANLKDLAVEGNQPSARSYITYNVEPGTVFKATVTLSATHAALHGETGETFKYIISGSNEKNGTYTQLGEIKTNGTINLLVPDDVSYIKIEFPQRGIYKNGKTHNTDGCFYGNHCGFLKDVTYVPSKINEGEVTYDYKGELGTASEVSSSTSNFNATTGAFAVNNGAILVSSPNWGSTDVGGLGSAHKGGKIGTQPKSAIVYNVEPGTMFSAEYRMSGSDRALFLKYGATDFEITFYGASEVNGTYTELAKTNTTSTNVEIKTVEILVPAGVRFIKVEFPQTGRLLESEYGEDLNGNGVATDQLTWGNHSVFIRKVSFVPDKSASTTYNYKEISANYLNDNPLPYTDGNFNAVAGVVAANKVIINGWTETDKLGMWVDNSGFSDSETDLRERSYIIYDVQPETEFKATFSGISDDHFELHPGETKDSFKVRVYASAAIDGTYEELGAYAGGAITVTVPAGKRFVKVEFPQRNQDTANKHWGNHCVFYQNVSFVKFYKDVPAVDTELNDYVAKGEVVLDEEVKTAYEIYDFDGVIGTKAGLAANADDAYVTYKVSNDQALIINSADKLDIAVSYDGKNFVDAQLTAFAGAYTVNVLEGKQYVKVALDAGETITAVKAAALAPTATFTNAAGAVEVIELDTYGATPVPTINTARAGYTFDKWDIAVGALWLDAEFKAEYNKNEEAFAITVENGAIVSVAGVECEADTTEANARFDDRVVIEAPATYNDGNVDLVFDKWVDANGNTVSNSHKFSFLASGSIVLEAVYAESKSEISPFIYNAPSAIITDNGSKWNMSVTWSVNVPAGTTIKETGIVLAATETTMEFGAANTYAMDHSSTATGKTIMYTVTGIKDGATRYARPYAVLADGSVIYGTTVTATDVQ